MALEERTFSSVAELLRLLPNVHKRSKTVWFRGQADHSWNLEPSLSRLGKLNTELQLIKQFKQNAHQFLERSSPLTEYDWIFLMQHYGVPTRLLDWTENPLIGLYFAVMSSSFSGKVTKGKAVLSFSSDAALWILDPIAWNRHALRLQRFDRGILTPSDEALQSYKPSEFHDRI